MSSSPSGPTRSGVASRRSYFSYGVAASYIGKDRPYDPSTHVFHFSPHNRPRTKRTMRPESGQDAFFASRVGDSGAVALGIADGVGGWMESGVDPADFSHGLCEYMATAACHHSRPAPAPTPAAEAAEAAEAPQVPISARQLMQLGYDAVRRDRSIPAGGSTAVVGVLTPSGMLEVANLGDSGFIHLRLNAVHAVSDPQTHAFNTPFQLSVIPPSLLARMATFGGAQLSDEPRDAEVSRHDLQHGDVLVFASDGVWDNLFNQDILHAVSSAMMATGAWRRADGAGVRVAPAADLKRLMHLAAPGPDVSGSSRKSKTGGIVTPQSLIATHITAAAKAASINTKRDGPFSKEVKRYYPQENWHGGKVDDICVVVAVVSEETSGANGEPTSEAPIQSRL